MTDQATLTVHGRATAPAQPDYLLVDISISETAPTSTEALGNAGQRWEMLKAALDELQIEARRRSGSSVALNPHYRAEGAGRPELDGWTASGMMTLRLASAELATQLIERIAAIPSAEMSAWRWVIAAENPARLEAGRNAVAAARARAEAIAAALGRSLGALIHASDGDASGPRPITHGGPVFVAAGGGARLAVEEGWSEVMSSVDLTFQLQ